jgi:hypothetical protein
MNTLVYAELELGHATLAVIEVSREAAEKLLLEAFAKYRESHPTRPWEDYTPFFRDMRVGEVMLDGVGYHMDPFNQIRWPDDYVQCAMTGAWFSPDDNPLAEMVANCWIQSPSDHTPEEIAEALDISEQQAYDEMGLEYPL